MPRLGRTLASYTRTVRRTRHPTRLFFNLPRTIPWDLYRLWRIGFPRSWRMFFSYHRHTNCANWSEQVGIFFIQFIPFLFFFLIWFVRLLALRPLLAYCASLGWYWRWLWRSRWNVDWQGKPKFSEKTCPSATFVHQQNPIWPDPGLNPGRRGGKPATNRLSYIAAYIW
jgi:hypothetical protein